MLVKLGLGASQKRFKGEEQKIELRLGRILVQSQRRDRGARKTAVLESSSARTKERHN